MTACVVFLSWRSVRSSSVHVSPSALHSLDNQILLISLDFFLFIPFVTYINSVSYKFPPEPLQQPPGIPASNPSPRCMVCTCQVTSQKQIYAGLPWWYSGEESACQRRGHCFDPWCRKISHAFCATSTEPTSCTY